GGGAGGAGGRPEAPSGVNLRIQGDSRPIGGNAEDEPVRLRDVLPDRVDHRKIDAAVVALGHLGPQELDRAAGVLGSPGRGRSESEEETHDGPLGWRPAGEALTALSSAHLELRVEAEWQGAVRDEYPVTRPSRAMGVR